jgi:putative oxidoreductase
MTRWLPSLGAYTLAGVLILSSLIHVQNPYAYLSSIYAYSIVPSLLGVVIAVLFPSLQITLGLVFLFCRRDWKPAFVLSGALMLLFTVVQIVALIRGLNISCGCFGRPEENPIDWLTVSRTALLMLTAFVGFWFCKPSDELRSDGPMMSKLA